LWGGAIPLFWAGRKDYYYFGKIFKIPLRRDSPPGIIIRSMDCPSGNLGIVPKGLSPGKVNKQA
jgi:hypothetical protein